MSAGAYHLTSSIYASFQSQSGSRGSKETWNPGQEESAWLQPTFQDDQVALALPLLPNPIVTAMELAMSALATVEAIGYITVYVGKPRFFYLHRVVTSQLPNNCSTTNQQ